MKVLEDLIKLLDRVQAETPGSHLGATLRRMSRHSSQRDILRPVVHRHLLPTCDEIASRAYELFLADGRRLSRLAEHWQRAECELLERNLVAATRNNMS